jgi:hypothetical protein
MVFFLVGIFVLCVGAILVAYGTAAKNRWGINLDQVVCPRCGTPPSPVHRPQSVRQAMWGGWTCEACGAEVDKWGRELPSLETPRKGKPKEQGQMHSSLKTKLILLAAGPYFCLTLILDWTGVTGGGFPTTASQGLFQVAAAAVETAIFTVLFFLALSRNLAEGAI